MKRVLYAMAISLLLLGGPDQRAELRAQSAPTLAMKASAIQVLMIQSRRDQAAADFQTFALRESDPATSETGRIPHVYRDGDHNAAGATDLVVLHSTVRGFKKGRRDGRNVTTVTGKTSIDVHCQFTDKDGKTVLERDLNGKVRFLGGNLRATLDFAKKAAKLSHDNFRRASVS